MDAVNQPRDQPPSDAELKEYHKWRALTAVLLDQKPSPREVDQRAGRVVDVIADILSPYATLKTAEFDDGLWRIVVKATRMDAELNKQRAIFRVLIPKSKTSLVYGYNPDPEICEWEGGSDAASRVVQICTAPAFAKDGNSDGENYEQRTMLVKAQVIVDTSEDTPRSAKLTGASLSPSAPRQSMTSQTSLSPSNTGNDGRSYTSSRTALSVGFKRVKDGFQNLRLPEDHRR